MILLRPEQIRLLALGLPVGNCHTGAEAAAALPVAEAVGAELALGGFGAEALLAGGVGASGAGAASFSLPAFIADNALSLGLQGAGSLVKAEASQDAANRRKRLSDAMAGYQSENASKAMKITGDHLDGSTPQARAAAMQDAETEGRLGYETTVGAAQAFQGPASVSGKVSDQYRVANEDSANAQSARTKMLIENLSKMRAPGMAGQAEARRYGRAAGGVGALDAANANVGRAYQSDIANVQENPWAMAGGDALSGIGQGIALRDGLKKLRTSAL